MLEFGLKKAGMCGGIMRASRGDLGDALREPIRREYDVGYDIKSPGCPGPLGSKMTKFSLFEIHFLGNPPVFDIGRLSWS